MSDKMRYLFAVFVFILTVFNPLSTSAQDQDAPSQMPKMSIDFMAGYGLDESQSSLGFETQGRAGYLIFRVDGKIGKRLKYFFEINPINETSPLPACGEPNFFYPNDPSNSGMGPDVVCNPDGRQRVDDYRFTALDTVNQQGFMRQAYITFKAGKFTLKGGRFILPIGFGWNETGSFTAKDAPHIQRINTESQFGIGIGYARPRVRAEAIVFSGDTRFRDYNYFYFIDHTMDANSGLNTVLSVTTFPVKNLEVRGAFKKGFSGSKVERLPNFWASKRNDDAVVLSAKYYPFKYVTVFGEYSRYKWGLMKTSADMLGRPDNSPVKKNGYYTGITGKYPITKNITAGITLTKEELSRDDSLVRYMAEEGLYSVREGKKEHSLTTRYFVTLYDRITAGFYNVRLSNPFPWLSGIAPIEGENAFKSRGDNKWGVVVRFTQKLN
jgi:hypothetical protein